METGASGRSGQIALKNVVEEKGLGLGNAMIQNQFKEEKSVMEVEWNQKPVMETHAQVYNLKIWRHYYKVSPVNGNWGLWSTWSECSESCGEDGMRSRRRVCDSPEPRDGGKSCDGTGFTFGNGNTEDCTIENSITEICNSKCLQAPCPSKLYV